MKLLNADNTEHDCHGATGTRGWKPRVMGLSSVRRVQSILTKGLVRARTEEYLHNAGAAVEVAECRAALPVQFLSMFSLKLGRHGNVTSDAHTGSQL